MRRWAVILAIALAVAVPVGVHVAAACSPWCAVIGNDIWNPLWWIYDCGSCPPGGSEG